MQERFLTSSKCSSVSVVQSVHMNFLIARWVAREYMMTSGRKHTKLKQGHCLVRHD